MKGLRILTGMLMSILLLALAVGLSQAQGPEGGVSPQAAVGTAFTYQGRLNDNGEMVSGTCDLEFKLYDAASGGSPVGSTITKGDVTVTDGLFTVQLDFGADAFTGQARWLEIVVDCGSGSATLSPRQPLTAAPYALAMPGLRTQSNATSPNVIGGHSGNNVTSGVVGATIGGGGRAPESDPGHNTVTRSYGTIGGGNSNQASGPNATVSGGYWNTASASHATVGGGNTNTASGLAATVGGGSSNVASGDAAMVPGGFSNTAQGNYSFAAGFRAKANHDGAFVWADSTNQDLASTANDQFLVRANGGAVITGTNDSTAMLSVTNLGSGNGIHGFGQNFGVYGSGNYGVVGEGNTAVFANGSSFSIYATSASGVALFARSNSGNPIEAHGGTPSDRVFLVENNGNVRADGTYYGAGGVSSGSADFAEMVLPGQENLTPGDVLAVDPDGRIVRSTEPYQTTVVGVYSTDPGFVAGNKLDKDGNPLEPKRIPLAVLGIVPVKASAENGAIQPGDLLTASSIPGHAMKARPNPPVGTVIGKALENLGDGTGVILMLVMLQ